MIFPYDCSILNWTKHWTLDDMEVFENEFHGNLLPFE